MTTNLSELPFVVPVELTDAIDDNVIEVHERFNRIGLRALQASNEDGLVTIDGDPEAGINILALPFQQAWKPQMMLRAHMHHEINNPEGLTIVLPNNSTRNSHYRLSEDEVAELHRGSLVPFYERQVISVEHALEKYRSIGKTSVNGFSFGGLTAIGIASIGSERLDITTIHSVETPNKETDPKSLRKDFLKSSGSVGGAVKDAGIPALSSAMRPDKLAIDFTNFGVGSLVNSGNRAIHNAMATPNFRQLTELALQQYPEAEIVAGHIAGSNLFDPTLVEYIRDPRFRVFFINEGSGSRKHATGDNIVAHALMMKK